MEVPAEIVSSIAQLVNYGFEDERGYHHEHPDHETFKHYVAVHDWLTGEKRGVEWWIENEAQSCLVASPTGGR